ncbi:MAG: tRNA (guanine(46)-N(7))-methyltransferase TrmB [Thiolinea sp.]
MPNSNAGNQTPAIQKTPADLIKPITSSQTDIHNNLTDVIQRNQQHSFHKPIADHTRKAFEITAATVAQRQQPIILDSGCGTAISTRHIARTHPNSLVIGIDRSEVRLGKQYEEQLPNNAITVRADLVDFWILAAEANWTLQHHFILYPNPYPKSAHLKRRWHAHPVFPMLLGLGGQLELRTNWQIYAEEFALALRLNGYTKATAESFMPDKYLTLFEKKYAEAGQDLYRCCVTL